MSSKRQRRSLGLICGNIRARGQSQSEPVFGSGIARREGRTVSGNLGAFILWDRENAGAAVCRKSRSGLGTHLNTNSFSSLIFTPINHSAYINDVISCSALFQSPFQRLAFGSRLVVHSSEFTARIFALTRRRRSLPLSFYPRSVARLTSTATQSPRRTPGTFVTG